MTEIAETPEQQIARRILRCVQLMQNGCTIAGPLGYEAGITGERDPLNCEHCASGFVAAVRQAVNGSELCADRIEAGIAHVLVPLEPSAKMLLAAAGQPGPGYSATEERWRVMLETAIHEALPYMEALKALKGIGAGPEARPEASPEAGQAP